MKAQEPPPRLSLRPPAPPPAPSLCVGCPRTLGVALSGGAHSGEGGCFAKLLKTLGFESKSAGWQLAVEARARTGCLERAASGVGWELGFERRRGARVGVQLSGRFAMASDHCDYEDFSDLGLQASEIPELPALPFADLAMSIEEGVGNPHFDAWGGQRLAMGTAAGGLHSRLHGLSASVGLPTTKTEWTTPPSSVSPQFSVASSPERDSSDSDEGGCTTPPKQLPANGGEARASAKRKADGSAAATGASAAATGASVEQPVVLGPLAYDAKTIEAQHEQRLRRNREAAQQFRKRKKEYVGCLEADCNRLRQENMQLRAQLSTATHENSVLREENAFYKNVVSGRANTAVPIGTVAPRMAKVSKVAGVTMCGLMMVAALVTNQPLQPGTGVVTAGASTAVATAAARRRLMTTNVSDQHDSAVPLPGMVWNSTVMSDGNVSVDLDRQKWLSLLQPRADYGASGDGSSAQAEWLGQLHSGYIQRDAAGDWSMDWDQLQRFGRMAKPRTRYIFCPDAQDLSGFAPPSGRMPRKDTPEVIQLMDDDFVAAPKGNEIATLNDVRRLKLDAVQSQGRPSAPLAIAESVSMHPPDFEPEELEDTDDQDWSAEHGFGVSLLIPTETNGTADGQSIPVVQMVEFRCEVANVTRHTFVE